MKQSGSTNTPNRKKPSALEFPAALAETITENDIRRRAYELYEKRGCLDGHATDDWLQAELEMCKPHVPVD